MEGDNNYNISIKAYIDYFLQQRNIYSKQITNEVNKSIKIQCNEVNEYIIFRDKYFIILVGKYNMIFESEVISYDQLFSEEFLWTLIKNRDKLYFKLARLAEKEYIEILKEKIIEALKLKRITLEYDTSEKYIIGNWKALKIKFILSEKLVFKNFKSEI